MREVTSGEARPIPTGRLRRTAKIGGLVGTEAARGYATKAVNLVRSPAERDAASARRRSDAAHHLVAVLGEMKGPVMKLGQMASMIDLSGLSADERDVLQAKLGELHDRAPQVPFNEMRKVIERDLGDRVSNLFADFDPDATAAASIGQVYRARLRDGREVAVKVQYPGIAAAVRADLQNLGLLVRAVKRLVPGLDAKTALGELRERISEELDYEHEAQIHRVFARRWRGHPFVIVPNVVSDLCRTRVLVTEWVDGADFDRVKQSDAITRNHVGEAILRFFFGSLYRFGQFSGDPHPGNFLLLNDGRVAFLDFGMTKTVSRARIDTELGILRAGLEQDAGAVHSGLAALGFFDLHDPRFDRARVLEHVHALNAWYAQDEMVALTPQYVAKVLADAGDPRSPYWDLMRNETLPAESLLASRMQAMTLAVIGQLGAAANWHRIMREWLYDAAPGSPLGTAEAEFFGRPGALARVAA